VINLGEIMGDDSFIQEFIRHSFKISTHRRPSHDVTNQS